MAFLEPPLVDRAKQCLKLRALASAEISVVVVYAGSFGARTEVDLDFFYFASLDGEELRVPRAAAILGFAIVEMKASLPVSNNFSMP